jgi:hypothetical protein
LFFSLLAPKQRTKEKAPRSLAFGSPREEHERGGRQELIPLLAGLRQLAALIPRPQPSLGYAATGFKTKTSKPVNLLHDD